MAQQNPNLSLNQRGKDVALLQSRLITLGYTIATTEILGEFFGESTRQAVQRFQQADGLPTTGVVDRVTAQAIVARLEGGRTVIMSRPPVSPQAATATPTGPEKAPDEASETIKRSIPLPAQGKPETSAQKPGLATVGAGDDATDQGTDAIIYTVTGVVSSPDRAGGGGLRVQLVDKNVGADVLLAEGTTDTRGNYKVSFSSASLSKRRKLQPDEQARVYIGQTFIGASEVRYNATTKETLNVILPPNSTALPSEYETLATTLSEHYTGSLGALQETAERQDITYLANKTGWDARAVAMAALADQLSQGKAQTTDAATTSTIRPEFYYALFRAGLPANAATLYQADAQTVGTVWKQALAQGIIPQFLESEIDRSVETFQALSAAHALSSSQASGLSTLQEMLQVTLGADTQRQQQFADLYVRYQNDPQTLWNTAEQRFGAATTARLQLDGQLGYLTLNNAPLIARLYDAERQSPLNSTLDLAQRGYYQAAKWLPLLDGAVPPEIPGSTPDEQRANYADLLATQVRLTFPTAVVVDLIKTGSVKIAESAEVQNEITSFLTENQGKFEIGMEPLERYLARTNLSNSVALPAVAQIKRLQRVYQLTPNDEAFTTLLQQNLDSAYQITRYDAASFVRSFQDALGGVETASLVYNRAQQIYGTVLNLVSTYLISQRAVVLGSDILNPNPVGQQQGTDPIVAYPTLEGLLGSMDYCACDDCRSILSPAAYLVNLLQFIDCLAPQKQNPQAVLFSRRPDIQYLPLTCENTNIALPYIDLVNETLEYFVTNGLSLTNYSGHNTDGTITSEELLASPQFVSDAAYTTLQNTFFPPPLPFHRPLELLRLHFQKFGIPLQDAMAALRPSDALERGTAAYGWRDILMEQLGLSRAEYRLLTDSTLTLQQIYGYPTLSDTAVISALSGFQDFSRRVGVSYEDLVSILQTQFINPSSALLPRLERLDVPFTTLQALQNGTLSAAAFEALLPAGLDPAEYGGDIVAWITDPANYAHIMDLIVIANPTDSTDLCSADDLQFRYANPDDTANTLHANDFVRLLRFIRLWQKLGLTIQQTDDLITALYPAADLPTGNDATDLQLLDTGFLALLPRIGFAFQVMNLLQLTADRDLSDLLACWAPIGTAGAGSLYQTMFLTPTLLQQDPAFADDGYGNFLQDSTQTLVAHEPALRAALSLTDAEFTLITSALGFGATTTLTLANVSAVYRRGWLARKLRLSVVEFLLLTQYTDLDPFVAPDPQTSPSAEPPAMRLIQFLQALSSAGLRPVQALYLIWNEDISGISAPQESSITDLARTLRADFAAVESQFTLVDDPNGDIARSLMALVYGTDTANFFFGLLNNTLAVSVSYANPQPTLAQPILDAASGRLSYDDLRKQLTYTGVLDTITLSALNTAIAANPPLAAAVAALSTANHKLVDPFFATYPELLPCYSAYVTSNDPPQTKRTTLLANFLPDLKQRRKQEQALAAVTAAAGTDSSFASALLEDATVLHTATSNTLAAINDLTAVEAPGLSAQFFLTNNVTAAPDTLVDAVSTLSYVPGGTNPLPAGTGGNPIAGIWSGYLDVPQDGFYDIAVATDAGATVALEIGGEAVTMGQNGNVWSNQSPISLTAGALSALVLTVTTLTSTLTVSWESAGLGWQIIPGTCLYSATSIDHLQAAYVRFLKATSLAARLSLTADEIAYLATNADLQVSGQGWLNALAISENPATPISISLRNVLSQILSFARIKTALSPGDERLLAILEDPQTTLPNGKSALLTLTGWDQGSLNSLLTQFFGNTLLSNLAHLENFRRVYDAYAVVTTCGISAAALSAATTNDPTAALVSALQSALRALYANPDWLTVIKPINDTMRDLQRSALVAYVLQQLGDQPATSAINTPDKLFEYFLMDVQMEPCMETSRIRHALSSVQLFIEHCLRNLEPDVSSGDIQATQWEWMKRYRVWEANREVFLWPENWLYPELRTDQSQFFKDTMSELLQSDITDDTATTAYLNYLSKLEEVAKMEPCGLYCVPSDPNKVNEVQHVVARTAGSHRKYYYRRLEFSAWTPWEEIKLEIEDTPVVPVVWQGRLLLFWLKILQQSPVDPTSPTPTSSDQNSLAQLTVGNVQSDMKSSSTTQAQVTVQATLCWSEYYNGKWQPMKTSDVNRPTLIGYFDPAGPNAFDRSKLHLRPAPLNGLPTDTLLLDLQTGGPLDLFGNKGPGFVFYNTHSLPLRVEDVAYPAYAFPPDLRLIPFEYPDKASSSFSLYYMHYSGGAFTKFIENDLLFTSIGERITVPQPDAPDLWSSPFFFEDTRNVFHVTTTESSIPIWRYPGYGVRQRYANPASKTIPPLVLQEQARLPRKFNPPITATNPGLGDPAPMRQLISEDANIHTALGTTSAVQYNGREIGPTGSVANQEIDQA